MPKYFNTTGPCFPRLHYMLPPKDRLVGASLERYIRDELYWVLHAPRQTGKTTFLQSWMHEINAGTEAVACYVSLEHCQEVTTVKRAMPAMAEAVREHAKRFHVPVPKYPSQVSPESMLSALLIDWAAVAAPKKLIVLFDEVDVVAGPALVSFLRQLRSGFAGRGIGTFPVSVALVGMRDLRDYLVSSKDGRSLNPGSPFNIKHDSATLSNFSEADIAALTSQHSQATGQQFAPEALERIWACSSGQPWLVNALAYEMAWKDKTARDRTVDITLQQYQAARERLIQSRATHLDQLADKLQEARVRRTVSLLLSGEETGFQLPTDDLQYLEDLGLIQRKPQVRIANRIYQEIIPRELTASTQDTIVEQQEWYVDPDQRLNMNK
ncbi:MAG: ATP-binding protein, partial [Candidatus Electrothrix sp. AR5]|nr:ATP-binding protein [Candidatus Electrothrix sp. AR5]